MENFKEKYGRITTESLGSVAIEGDLTPEKLFDAQQALVHSLESFYILAIHYKQWNDMQTNVFADWLDPCTKFEMIHRGEVARLLGMCILTDGFAQPEDRVLNPDVSVLFRMPKEFQINVI